MNIFNNVDKQWINKCNLFINFNKLLIKKIMKKLFFKHNYK